MAETLHRVRVLVTGGTGFIGSHLTRRLVGEGAEVHVLDLPAAASSRIADVLGSVTLHRADLADGPSLQRTVREIAPRKVFHLAALTDVGRGLDRLGPALTDLQCTLNLLRGLDGVACDTVVYAGTCEEYGDQAAPFREDMPPRPVSAYSASKAAGTLFCEMLHKTTGLPVVIVRPFLVYGPHQHPSRFLSAVIDAALRGTELPMTPGEQTREFNYVSDTVDGFVRAAVTPAAVGQIINIGNGIEYTLKDAIARVAAACGRPVAARFGALPYRPGESMRFYCDNTKARHLLGWEPKVDFDTGLRLTIDWCRRERRQEKS